MSTQKTIEATSMATETGAHKEDEAYGIHTLTKQEKKNLKKVEEFEDVSMNEISINKNTKYVVLYKHKRFGLCCTFPTIKFVYFCSKDKQEAKKIFNITKYNVNKVMKCLGKKGQKQEAALLKDVVALTVKNQTWRSSHIAAQMHAYHLFDEKNDIIVKDMSKEVKQKTCLHIALTTQNWKTVRAILTLKPDLGAIDENGNTPIHYAAATTVEIFKTVVASLDAKELVTKKNNEGCTPLHFACFANKPEIVIEFLKMNLTVADLTVAPPTPNNTTDSPSGSDQKSVTVPKFTDQMIEDMDMKDMIFGGCPLHWTTTRRSIEVLLKYGFDANTKNMGEETPLVVHTKRRRLRSVIALLCDERTDTEVKNAWGETALHEAVRQLDIPMVQTLMVFDANLNAKNNDNETPRHLVSSGKSSKTSAHDIILYALHILGAERCSSSMKDCGSGCSNNETFNGKPYAKWGNFDEEPLYKRILLEQTVKKALFEKNNDREEYDNKKKNVKTKKKVTMICMDGGGVRGLITAQILIELQKFFPEPLIKHFDWVVGTSTGAMMAALLCTKHSPTEIRKIYFMFKNKIMVGSKPYSSREFEKAIKANINEELWLSDIKDHNLVLTTTLADRHPAQLHLFRNYESQIAKVMGGGNNQFMQSLPDHRNMKLWEACRASASAPVYFNPYGPYIDGGVISNNPTLDGLAEFTLYNELLRYTGNEDETEELRLVVSVGTGKIPVTLKHPLRDVATIIAWNPADAYRNAIMAKDLLRMILDQATGTDAHVVHRAQTWCHGIGVPYFRVNPPLSETMALDTTDDEELINVMWETKAYMYSVRPRLAELVHLLALRGEKITLPLEKPGKEDIDELEPGTTDEKEQIELLKDFRNDYKLQDTLLK